MQLFSKNSSDTQMVISDARSVEHTLKTALKLYLEKMEKITKLPDEMEYPLPSYAYSIIKYE